MEKYSNLKKSTLIVEKKTHKIEETKTKEIKISDEHTGFIWLPIEEAVKRTTFKNSKKLLKEADEFVVKYINGK